MTKERLLNAKEVALIFRVTPVTVRNLIEKGELPAIRVGERWRVKESAVEFYLDENSTERTGKEKPTEK